MTKNFNLNTDNNDEWLTQPELIKALGHFDLDPCAPIDRPWDTAAHHYTKNDDGLRAFWYGRIWLNPPYGQVTFDWMHRLADHKGGGIGLVFARTETIGFHEAIWDRAHSVFMFKGRLKFYQQLWEVSFPEAGFDNEWYTPKKIREFKDDLGVRDLHVTGASKWDNSTPANAPSCLVSYSSADTRAISVAMNTQYLKGKLISL